MPTNEAMRICGLTANAEGHHGGDPDCVCGDIDRLVAAAVKAERERLIPLVCFYCKSGLMPEREDDEHDPRWLHGIEDTSTLDLCRASPIREAIHADALEQGDG